MLLEFLRGKVLSKDLGSGTGPKTLDGRAGSLETLPKPAHNLTRPRWGLGRVMVL